MGMTKANRTEIFTDFLAGDQQAFRLIYEHYYSRLCNYLFQYTQNDALSEDLAQETLMMLWKKRESLEPRGLNTFLYRSAYHRYIDQYRRAKFVDRELEAFRRESLDALVLENDEVFDTKLRLVKKAIAQLPPRCQEIFVLNKQNGLSHKEIAQRFGISPKTVENQIGKALKSIREQVKEHIFTLFVLVRKWMGVV